MAASESQRKKCFSKLDAIANEVQNADAISMWREPISYDEIMAKFDQRLSSKPNGIWYSCGREWLDWICRNVPNWWQPFIYKLKLDKQHFLRITTTYEFDRFEEKYIRQRKGFEFIDWPLVASRFSGIEICPFIHPRRHSWYFGWDVASGCFWDGNVLQNAKQIRTPHF